MPGAFAADISARDRADSFYTVLAEQGNGGRLVPKLKRRREVSAFASKIEKRTKRAPRRGKGYLLQPKCVAIADPYLRVCCATGTRLSVHDGRARNAGGQGMRAGRTRTTERVGLPKTGKKGEKRRGPIWAWDDMSQSTPSRQLVPPPPPLLLSSSSAASTSHRAQSRSQRETASSAAGASPVPTGCGPSDSARANRPRAPT